MKPMYVVRYNGVRQVLYGRAPAKHENWESIWPATLKGAQKNLGDIGPSRATIYKLVPVPIRRTP